MKIKSINFKESDRYYVTFNTEPKLRQLVRTTWEHPSLLLGASPRASLGLFRLAQAMAAIQGKAAVSVELVKSLVMTVLAHRLIVKPDRMARYHNGGEAIKEMLDGRRPE